MAELAQLITSIATLLGVVFSIFLGLRGLEKINKVEQHTNGLVSRLETGAHNAGVISGVKQERKRADDEADKS